MIRAGLYRYLTALSIMAVAFAFTPAAIAVPSPRSTPLPKSSVVLTVTDLTPTTPTYSAVAQVLDFRLSVTNTTNSTLRQATLLARREAPINQQKLLQAAFDNPTTSRNAIAMHSVTLGSFSPHETRTITYLATASSLDDGSVDICLCVESAGIYPIDFSVNASTSGTGTLTSVGSTQTYLPAFAQTPQPVRVSWIWPLIDRPHRITSTTVFTDDELGISIALGGRLDRSLQVLERIQTKARITLMIDPELISELLVMSSQYSVGTIATPGTHTADAVSWLTRFRAIAAVNQVEFTASSDPDTEALVREKLNWSSAVAASAAGPAGSGPAGGGPAGGGGAHDLAWPADGLATAAGIKALVASGARSIVLDDSLLAQPEGDSYAASSLAALDVSTPDGQAVKAIVTDKTVQKLAATAVSPSVSDTGNASALPKLISAVAMRAAASPSVSHYLAITAPRYVNPNVEAAVRTILETASTDWAQPITVGEAVTTLTSDIRNDLIEPTNPGSISGKMLGVSAVTTSFARAFAGSFVSPADAAKVLSGYSDAAQRAASTSWRNNVDAAETFADALALQITALRAAIHIVTPANGSYTLASADSTLFVSVVNTLPYPVRVQVKVSMVGSALGITTDSIGAQTIQANGNQVTLRVPAHVQRTGRFEVEAFLLTPAGASLGNPVRLSVRSTALGKVGVVITVGAGVVLALALLLRLIRRLRRRPARPSTLVAP